MTRRLPRLFFFLSAVLLLDWAAACRGGGGHPPQAAVPVLAATAARRDVPLSLRATGTVEPIESASVKARVTGMVTALVFAEGQEVQAGQLLVQLDARPYEAALGQARARLEKDRAQLAHARAQLARYESLSTEGIVSADQMEMVRTQADVLQSAVEEDEQAVLAARLDVAYAAVRAPIAGRAGAVLVKKGNVVKANEAVVVTLNRMRPIRVAFALPGQSLSDILRYGGSSGHGLAVRVGPSGSSGKEIEGRLDFVDNAVSPETGTVALKAVFENADGALWPGQFLDVELILDVEKGLVAVPDSAVLTGQQGTFLFVVAEGRARSRSVVVARSAEGFTAIARGVGAGETVVTDGQLRLFDGAPVEIKTSLSAAGPPQ